MLCEQQTHHGSHTSHSNHTDLVRLEVSSGVLPTHLLLAFLMATSFVASSIFCTADSCLDIVIGRNNLIVLRSEVALSTFDQDKIRLL